MRALSPISVHPVRRAQRLCAVAAAVLLVVSCSTAAPGTPSPTSGPSSRLDRGSASPSGIITSPTPSPTIAITGTWIDAGKLKLGRVAPHMVLLGDDRVLVVGSDSHCVAYVPEDKHEEQPQTGAMPDSVRADVWDPATSTWTKALGLDKPRDHFGLVALDNGRALVVGGVTAGVDGGWAQQSYSSAWTFDPRREIWSRTSSMNTARTDPAIAVLADGRILVAGGAYEDYGYATVDDGILLVATVDRGSAAPGMGPFADMGPMGPPVPILAKAELYDPRTDTWTRTGSMRVPRFGAAAVTLADGRVLVVGQSADTMVALRAGWQRLYEPPVATAFRTAETFDPRTGRFSLTGKLPSEVSNFSLVALEDGGALLIGGYPTTAGKLPLATVLRFDPKTKDWSRIDSLGTARANALAVRLADGRVLVAGGETRYGSTATAELFDPTTGRWSSVPSMPEPRAWGAATLLSDGSVLIVGGYGPLRTAMGEATCPKGLATSVRFVPTP